MIRSFIVLWLVLAAAIGSVVAFAQFWVVQRREGSQQRVRAILRSQLEPINNSITKVIEGYSLELQDELIKYDIADPAQCVELMRHPLADFVAVVDGDARLAYPNNFTSVPLDRQTLIDEAQQLLSEQLDFAPTSNSNDLLVNSPTQTLNPTTDLQDDSAYSKLRGRSYVGNSIAANAPRSNSASQLELPPTELPQQIENSAASQMAEFDAQQFEQGPQQQTSIAQQQMQPQPAPETNLATIPSDNFGWMTWYHRRGMVLGFWWHQSDDFRTLVGLPSARWKADIVGTLPSSNQFLPMGKASFGNLSKNPSDNTLSGQIKQLVDVEGNVIYQWGEAPDAFWSWLEDTPDPMADEQHPGLSAEISVGNPLEGWRLRLHATEQLVEQLGGDSMVLPIWLAVTALSATMILGGLVITLNMNRQFRLAEQRVSFVNQVSHELRTPLTNICMYADLLANDLAADDEAAEASPSLSRLSVIQNESRRLNRLIGNVLEFARSGSKPKAIRPISCSLDALLQEVLETFLPRLDEIGFAVDTQLGLPEHRELDPDAVEQILVNLISNAEKYAVGGKTLRLRTWSEGDMVFLSVEDDGPGVPRRMADRIFAPFERISHRLEDPAGTGIGLTIVRELAERHGGGCKLLETNSGAHFQCKLLAPRSADS